MIFGLELFGHGLLATGQPVDVEEIEAGYWLKSCPAPNAFTVNDIQGSTWNNQPVTVNTFTVTDKDKKNITKCT